MAPERRKQSHTSRPEDVKLDPLLSTSPPRHHGRLGEAAQASTSPPSSPPRHHGRPGEERQRGTTTAPRRGTYDGLFQESIGPSHRSHSIQRRSTAKRNPRAVDLAGDIRRASFKISGKLPKRKPIDYCRHLTSAISSWLGCQRGSGSGRRTVELPS
jgi:hypothetical protein